MNNPLWKIFTSLRLTVTLLSFGILLVFIGTVAQADEGLYVAQERYFKHWWVFGISFFGHKIPMPLPGGYLIGTLLLVNLTCAFIKRFQWSPKKVGIYLTHVGIILLLVGQLATDLLSRETQMRIHENESKNYSESGMDYELAFETDVDTQTNEVVVIPQALLAKGGELKHEKLPFTVRVKQFWPNTNPSFRAPAQENAPPVTTNGVATSFDFEPTKITHDMNSKNVPTAIVELVGASGSLGTWVAPGWAGDDAMAESLGRYYAKQMGPQMGATIRKRLTTPQVVSINGKEYTMTLRPERAYKPFSFTLLKATHSVYQGTEIPKDFRSRILIDNPAKGEKRETEIFMNNPLRYAGLTFFQFQMSADEMVLRSGETPSSTLQVVRNPGWITPYAGCVIVAAGLIYQFMFHLSKFLKRRTA
jgi:hypothetical protein